MKFFLLFFAAFLFLQIEKKEIQSKYKAKKLDTTNLLYHDYCDTSFGDLNLDTIDIMVLFTTAASIELLNGEELPDSYTIILDSVNYWIDNLNEQINLNSGVNIFYDLVYVEHVNGFVENPSDILGDLNKLNNPNDGNIDFIHELRNEYNADIVCLLTDGDYSQGAGVANFPSISVLKNGNIKEVKVANEDKAFCIVEASAALKKYTLAHEIGHILGAGHDLANLGANGNNDPNVLLCPSSLGYSNMGDGWFTIMATCTNNNGCSGSEIRIPYYSNPDVQYNGKSTGSNDANVAAGLNNVGREIATFRQSKEDENQALVDLYWNTNGPQWLVGWDLSNEFTNWPGVDIIDVNKSSLIIDPRVSELNLSNYALSGNVPNLKLPLLEVLNLSDNNISTQIPDFRYLWNIKTINFDDNNIQGDLPPFSNCTELEYLSLQNNEITGHIWDFLMPNLSILDLSSNELTGEIPNFSYFPKIKSLKFKDNNLLGEIPDLSVNVDLDTFDIRENKFTFQDLIPNFINNNTISNFLYYPQKKVGVESIVNIGVNESYTLCVDIDQNLSSNIYTWYKDGVPIDVTATNELIIQGVTLNDNGIYHCEVTNTGVPNLVLLSENITLNIFEPLPIIWSENYGTNQSDKAYDICASNDNTSYVSCGLCYTQGGQKDFCIKKIDIENDSLDWSKEIGGTSTDIARSIIPSNDNLGYVVLGHSRSSDGYLRENRGQYDLWLVSINEIGDTIWTKTFGGSFGENAVKIIPTNDKTGYLILGQSASNDGDLTGQQEGKIDYWVLRVDNNGEKDWSFTYGGSDYDYPDDIIPAIDGDGYIIIGSSKSSNGDITSKIGSQFAWYCKISESGTISWERSYNPGSQISGLAITKNNKNDGYIIGGRAYGVSGGPPTFYSIVQCSFEIDSIGDVNWFKYYTTYSSNGFYDICTSNDGGGYLICGYQYPNGEVIRIDDDGNKLWSIQSGGMAYSIISSINNDGYIIAGNTQNNASNSNGKEDWWIYQLGGILPSASMISGSVNTEALFDNEYEFQALIEENNLIEQVYPNPVNSNLIVTLSTVKDEKVKYMVYDILGNKILQGVKSDFGESSLDIDLSRISPGVYLVVLKTESQWGQRQFVKQ